MNTSNVTTVLTALLIGAVLEAIAVAPLVLSPWGHAGPDSIWGFVGLFLNAPALIVIWLGRTMSGSRWDSIPPHQAIAYIYVIQTLIFSCIAYFWLRRRRRRRSRE